MVLAGGSIFSQFVGIDAFLIVNSAEYIGNGYYLHTFAEGQLGGPAAYIAKALYGAGSAFYFHAFDFQCFQRCGYHALAGGCRTSQGTAYGNILAGDEAGFELAGDLAVFVHHPAHDLGIGVHVRSRNILLFADNAGNLINIAAGQGFQFPFRQLAYVNDDAALAAAVRQARNRAFAGHPERQGLYFVHIYSGMVPYAAFGRSHDSTVLAAVPGKYLYRTVIHLYRNLHFGGLFRFRNDSGRARIQFHCLNCLVQRNHRLFDKSHDNFPLTSINFPLPFIPNAVFSKTAQPTKVSCIRRFMKT